MKRFQPRSSLTETFELLDTDYMTTDYSLLTSHLLTTNSGRVPAFFLNRPFRLYS